MRLLPVLLLILFFPGKGFNQSTEIFRGNTFNMSPANTAEVSNPVSGKTDTEAVPPTPLTMNGEHIYSANSLITRPVFTGGNGTERKLSTLLFDSLKNELQQLEDGEYIIDIKMPVISKEGRLVYYKMGGIKRLTQHAQSSTKKMNDAGKPATYTLMSYTADDKNIPVAKKSSINQRTTYLLEHLPAMKPGTISNKPVHATGELFHSGSCKIKVNNHTALFQPGYFTL
jgi:hypothetical protein